MGAKTFQELTSWQLARDLRRTLYALLRKPVFADDRDFRWQVRRAARSATGNIAEGFSCTHAEFARFLDIAARSLREIEDRLIEAVDEGMRKPRRQRAFSVRMPAQPPPRFPLRRLLAKHPGPTRLQASPAEEVTQVLDVIGAAGE